MSDCTWACPTHPFGPFFCIIMVKVYSNEHPSGVWAPNIIPKMNVILLRILTMLSRSKCCSAELPLRVGVIQCRCTNTSASMHIWGKKLCVILHRRHPCVDRCSSGGGGTSSKNHMKKLNSFLRYVESPRGFTEIKQVSTRSIQVCRGSTGFNAWNPFVLRVEHLCTIRKLEKSLEMGETSFHCKKTACYGLQQQTKVHALALARQTTIENCTKSIR